MSPSNIPALIILSPETFKVKMVSLAGIKLAGKVKNSLGFSIASIGVPAVTLPKRGTLTNSSFLGINSFSPLTSIVLNLDLVLEIAPLSSNCFKWVWTVAGLDKPKPAHISLTDGGKPYCTIYFLINVNTSFCFLVSFSFI